MKKAAKFFFITLIASLLAVLLSVTAFAEGETATVVYPDGTEVQVPVGETIVPPSVADGYYHGQGNTLFKVDAAAGWQFALEKERTALSSLEVTESLAGKRILALGASQVYYTTKVGSTVTEHSENDLNEFLDKQFNTGYTSLLTKVVYVTLYADMEFSSFNPNWEDSSATGNTNCALDLNGHSVTVTQTEPVKISGIIFYIYSNVAGAQWRHESADYMFSTGANKSEIRLGDISSSATSIKEYITFFGKSIFTGLQSNGGSIFGGVYEQSAPALTFIELLKVSKIVYAKFTLAEGSLALFGDTAATKATAPTITNCQFSADASVYKLCKLGSRTALSLAFTACTLNGASLTGVTDSVIDNTTTVTLPSGETVSYTVGQTIALPTAEQTYTDSGGAFYVLTEEKWVLLGANGAELSSLTVTPDMIGKSYRMEGQHTYQRVYYKTVVDNQTVYHLENDLNKFLDKQSNTDYKDFFGGTVFVTLYADMEFSSFNPNWEDESATKNTNCALDLNGHSVTVTQTEPVKISGIIFYIYSNVAGAQWHHESADYMFSTGANKSQICLGDISSSATQRKEYITFFGKSIFTGLQSTGGSILGGVYEQSEPALTFIELLNVSKIVYAKFTLAEGSSALFGDTAATKAAALTITNCQFSADASVYKLCKLGSRTVPSLTFTNCTLNGASLTGVTDSVIDNTATVTLPSGKTVSYTVGQTIALPTAEQTYTDSDGAFYVLTEEKWALIGANGAELSSLTVTLDMIGGSYTFEVEHIYEKVFFAVETEGGIQYYANADTYVFDFKALMSSLPIGARIKLYSDITMEAFRVVNAHGSAKIETENAENYLDLNGHTLRFAGGEGAAIDVRVHRLYLYSSVGGARIEAPSHALLSAGDHVYTVRGGSKICVAGGIVLGESDENASQYGENLTVLTPCMLRGAENASIAILGVTLEQSGGAEPFLPMEESNQMKIKGASFITGGEAEMLLFATTERITFEDCRFIHTASESVALFRQDGEALGVPAFKNCYFYNIYPSIFLGEVYVSYADCVFGFTASAPSEKLEGAAFSSISEVTLSVGGKAYTFKYTLLLEGCTVVYPGGLSQIFPVGSRIVPAIGLPLYAGEDGSYYTLTAEGWSFRLGSQSSTPLTDLTVTADMLNKTVYATGYEKAYLSIEANGEITYYTNASTYASILKNYLGAMDAGARITLYANVTLSATTVSGKRTGDADLVKSAEYFLDLNGKTLTFSGSGLAMDIKAARFYLYSSTPGGRIEAKNHALFRTNNDDYKWVDGKAIGSGEAAYGQYTDEAIKPAATLYIGEIAAGANTYGKNLTVVCASVNEYMYGTGVYFRGGTFVQSTESTAGYFLLLSRTGTSIGSNTHIKGVENTTFVITQTTAPLYYNAGLKIDFKNCKFISTVNSLSLFNANGSLSNAPTFSGCQFYDIIPEPSRGVTYTDCVFGFSGSLPTVSGVNFTTVAEQSVTVNGEEYTFKYTLNASSSGFVTVYYPDGRTELFYVGKTIEPFTLAQTYRANGSTYANTGNGWKYCLGSVNGTPLTDLTVTAGMIGQTVYATGYEKVYFSVSVNGEIIYYYSASELANYLGAMDAGARIALYESVTLASGIDCGAGFFDLQGKTLTFTGAGTAMTAQSGAFYLYSSVLGGRVIAENATLIGTANGATFVIGEGGMTEKAYGEKLTVECARVNASGAAVALRGGRFVQSESSTAEYFFCPSPLYTAANATFVLSHRGTAFMAVSGTEAITLESCCFLSECGLADFLYLGMTDAPLLTLDGCTFCEGAVMPTEQLPIAFICTDSRGRISYQLFLYGATEADLGALLRGALNALDGTASIRLCEDVLLSERTTLSSIGGVTLDLNGHTVTVSADADGAFAFQGSHSPLFTLVSSRPGARIQSLSASALFYAADGEDIDLVIDGENITVESGGALFFSDSAKATLTVRGGAYLHGGDAIDFVQGDIYSLTVTDAIVLGFTLPCAGAAVQYDGVALADTDALSALYGGQAPEGKVPALLERTVAGKTYRLYAYFSVDSVGSVDWGYGLPIEVWGLGETATHANATVGGMFGYTFLPTLVNTSSVLGQSKVAAVRPGVLRMSLTLQGTIGLNIYLAETLGASEVSVAGATYTLSDMTAEDGYYRLTASIAPNLAHVPVQILLSIGAYKHAVNVSIEQYAAAILAEGAYAAAHDLTYAMVEHVEAQTGTRLSLCEAPEGYRRAVPTALPSENAGNTLLHFIAFQPNGTVSIALRGEAGTEVELTLSSGRRETLALTEDMVIFEQIYINEFFGTLTLLATKDGKTEEYKYSLENYLYHQTDSAVIEKIQLLYNYTYFAHLYADLLNGLSADTDKDHLCDVCQKSKSAHKDANADGVCEHCGKETDWSEGFTFAANADGSYTLTGIGTCTDTTLVIPATYLGQPVTAIGESAFAGKDILRIVLTDSVKTIGESAFSGCTSLAAIEIGTGLASVAENAFAGCGTITVYYGGRAAGWGAIEMAAGNTALTDATVFFYCEHAPATDGYFWYYGEDGEILIHCKDMDKDHLCDDCGKQTECRDENRDHLCDVCGKTLSACQNNDANHLCDICGKVLTDCEDDNGDHLCDICGERITPCEDIDLDGDHLCEICGENAGACTDADRNHICDECAHTISLCADEDGDGFCDVCGREIFPQGLCFKQKDDGTYAVISIGDCTDPYLYIPSIYNGAPVTEIAPAALVACRRLIGVSIPDSVKKIGYAAFAGCSNLREVAVGDRVREIGAAAFALCSSLERVTLGDRVEIIGLSAFANCVSLTDVAFGDALRVIRLGAFSGCTALTETVLPAGLQTLGLGAFSGCKSLDRVVMPASVLRIGHGAFSRCPSLDSICYAGDSAGFDEITVAANNRPLESAELYFYTAAAQTEQGSFWYYGEDGKIVTGSLCEHTDENHNLLCDVCGKAVDCVHELDETGGGCLWCNYFVCLVHKDHNHDLLCDYCTAAVDCTAHADQNMDGFCDACGEQVEPEFTWESETVTLEINNHSGGTFKSLSQAFMAGIAIDADPVTENLILARNAAATEATGVSASYRYLPDDLIGEYAWSKNYERIAVEQEIGKYADVYCNFGYDMLAASLLGCFANLKTELSDNYFDFAMNESYAETIGDSEGYMYEYMESLAFDSDRMYLLASDYFIDLARAFYCIPVNATMLSSLGENAVETLAAMAESGAWTYDALLRYSAAFTDANASSDQVGLVLAEDSLTAAGLLYTSSVSLYDGADNEALYLFADQLDKLIGGKGVLLAETASAARARFASGGALFGGVTILASLETSPYRDLSDGVLILPVPVHVGSADYATRIHDTGRIGAISAKTEKFGPASAFLNYQSTHSGEVLSSYFERELAVGAFAESEALSEVNLRMLALMREHVGSQREQALENTVAIFGDHPGALSPAGDITFGALRWQDVLREEHYESTYVRLYYRMVCEQKQELLKAIFSNGVTSLPR